MRHDRLAQSNKHNKPKWNKRRRQLQDEIELEAELEAETALMQSRQQNQAMQRQLSQLRTSIRRQIEKVWNKPRSTPAGRTCKVKVRLLPGGEVGGVTVMVSSGNQPFDASVEQAVWQASPFPYPDSVELRKELKELEMTFVHQE